MNDLLVSVLHEARHENRATSIIGLAERLCEFGYGDGLELGITSIVAKYDSSADAVLEVEDFVYRNVMELVTTLGLEVDFDECYRRPDQLLDIVNVILEEIESYDDFDSLLSIVDSGEPRNIVIGNLTAFIKSTSASDYHTLVNDATEKLHKTIRGALIARQMIDDSYEADFKPEIVRNVVQFCKMFPSNPAVALFENYGYTKPTNELISEVDIPYDVNQPTMYPAVVGQAAAGIVLTKCDTYDKAYEAKDGVISQIMSDEHKDMIEVALRYANAALETIFNEGANNEEA